MGTERRTEDRLQSTSHFASSARAIIPAASGAEALVPVWCCVQTPRMSVVNCVSNTYNGL